MDDIDLGLHTSDVLHRQAGAISHRAFDAAGTSVNPTLRGTARRASFPSGFSVSVVDFANQIASSETECPSGRQFSLFVGGGDCSYAVDDATSCRVGPGSCLIAASPTSYLARVRAQPGQTYRFVSIMLRPDWGADLLRHPTGADDPLLRLLALGDTASCCATLPLPSRLQALARDFFLPRLNGACGVLIAEARTLEIVAGIADALAPVETAGESHLTRADTERLREAKRLIDTEPEIAFTLPVLSRRVGINVNKLKAGFKLLFGETVGVYAARVRMAHAYHLLAGEGLPVSSVAYRLGYSPAHFAQAFRRRYGVQPSRIASASHALARSR